jgi:hypothetical protein
MAVCKSAGKISVVTLSTALQNYSKEGITMEQAKSRDYFGAPKVVSFGYPARDYVEVILEDYDDFGNHDFETVTFKLVG